MENERPQSWSCLGYVMKMATDEPVPDTQLFSSAHLPLAATTFCTAGDRKDGDDGHVYWAIQRSWFARVNALRNLSRKKSRKVVAVTSGQISE